MRNTLKNFIYQGTDSQYNEDTNRRILVVNLFSAVGMSLTFLLGMRALFGHDYPLAGMLLIACIMFALSQRIQVIEATPKGRAISVILLLSCLKLLMALLIVTGGNANTGPLWIYIVSPVTMFFAGFKRGLVALSVFTLLICILLFFPNDALLLTYYPLEFKTRLLYSFLTVSFLSAFYEYSRERSYNTALYLSEQFERQARHDPLTQILNRRGGQNNLELEFSRQQRNGKPFAIALADIDRFKSINDNKGHELGDEILKRVARLFASQLRAQDTLARWGGEEFLFIFPETNEIGAANVAEKIRKKLSSNPYILEQQPITVTSSFGICEIGPNTSLTDALNLADQALYKAKHNGRNQVYLASKLQNTKIK